MKKIFFTLIIILLPNFLQADNQYWYAGGGLGLVPSVKNYDDNNNLIYNSGTTSVNYAILSGYNFNNWFALEGEFNYGNPEYSTLISTFNGKYYSLHIAPVFKYIINEKHVPYVKIGVGHMIYQETGSYMVKEFKGFSSKITFGYDYLININNTLGLNYSFNKLYNYNYKNLSGGYSTSDYDLTYSSLNFQYKYSFK